MTAPQRAALYLRVSTAKQAEQDVSIPDQQRQGEAYCQSRGFELVETYVEAGASATTDRRPEFQRMIEAGTGKPPQFDVIVVHSFSRFFRDHFELEFYVRKLAKNGVRLVSITQEIGDDPVHVMMRQIMALFDEYQSRENAKHTLRAMKENARQGFWNGAVPPIGYRLVAAEQRGARVKKKLEIDPLHAETVRLMFRLAHEGAGDGPLGVRAIVNHLNAHSIFTRSGARWGVGAVHQVLTRRTYVGIHEFNRRRKGNTPNPREEVLEVAAPPIVDREIFDAVQARLKSRSPKMVNPAIAGGVNLLTGILHCTGCGGAMTVTTGKSGRYRYYACGNRTRKGPTACSAAPVRLDKLDALVVRHLEEQLLNPERLEQVLKVVLDRRSERAAERGQHVAELNKRAAEAEQRLKRLYGAIETGVADLADPALKERISSLKSMRDQAQADAERASALLQSSGGQAVTPDMIRQLAVAARRRLRRQGGGYRRDYVRLVAHRIEVGDRQVRIMGSRSGLLKTLSAAGEGNSGGGVPWAIPKWLPG